jgi:hypothetical protein
MDPSCRYDQPLHRTPAAGWRILRYGMRICHARILLQTVNVFFRDSAWHRQSLDWPQSNAGSAGAEPEPEPEPEPEGPSRSGSLASCRSLSAALCSSCRASSAAIWGGTLGVRARCVAAQLRAGASRSACRRHQKSVAVMMHPCTSALCCTRGVILHQRCAGQE